MVTATDALQQVIEQAVEAGVRKALKGGGRLDRRLITTKDAAAYLALSQREVYNMIAVHQLPAVSHGRRKMLDIQDLDIWIERNKDRRP